MAKILADRDIKRLIGHVLLDADEKLLNPNGIELRLGKHVRFHSTGEEKELGPGMFLQVNPGARTRGQTWPIADSGSGLANCIN